MKRLEKILCATLEAMLQGKKPRMPDAGREVLEAFMHLSRARSYHQHGPNPIAWEALAAYGQVTGRPIPLHHADIIIALDDVWMRATVQRMAGQASGTPTVPVVSSTPLFAGLFDALTGG